MGTILASAIMTEAGRALHDEGFDRWTRALLFAALNLGQREVVFLKPDTNAQSAAVKLAAGAVQALPAGGVGLIRITHNMGIDGLTPGRAVTPITVEKLAAWQPFYAAADASAEVKHYSWDAADPTRFTVFPPQPAAGQGYVQMVYGATPADMVAPGPTDYDVAINIADVYANLLLYFALYWAFSVDADHSAGAAARAVHYYQLLLALLGRKDVIEAGLGPLPAAQHEVP